MNMKVTNNGSVTTYSFNDKSELDAWAKQNIDNSAVLSEVLKPVILKGKPVNNVVYEKTTSKAV